MFNPFSKKSPPDQDPENNEDVIASITYLIKQDADGVSIDVSLADFEKTSIEALCSILNALGNDICYVDTINIIKGLLIKENRYDILVSIFSKIEASIKDKLSNTVKNKIKDEPCIKPSEIFR